MMLPGCTFFGGCVARAWSFVSRGRRAQKDTPGSFLCGRSHAARCAGHSTSALHTHQEQPSSKEQRSSPGIESASPTHTPHKAPRILSTAAASTANAAGMVPDEELARAGWRDAEKQAHASNAEPAVQDFHRVAATTTPLPRAAIFHLAQLEISRCSKNLIEEGKNEAGWEGGLQSDGSFSFALLHLCSVMPVAAATHRIKKF